MVIDGPSDEKRELALTLLAFDVVTQGLLLLLMP